MIFLEDNQMQRIFGDELIRTSDLPIHKFTTGVQKHSLDKGLPSLRVLLENRKFRIPRGDAHSVEMTDLWISEMQAMTWDKGKIVSVGAHDDLVMGNWICDQCIRHGGFQFSFGDDDYDGNLDDFLDEITGKTDKSAPSSTLEGGPGAVVKPDVAPPELEGEELLKVLLRRQMAGKKTAVQPKMLRPVPGEPGVGDLVNEDEFW